MKKLFLSSTAAAALTLGTGTLALQGCEDQTPAEKAIEERSEEMQDRADEMGDKMENAGEKIGDNLEKTGDKIEEKTNDNY